MTEIKVGDKVTVNDYYWEVIPSENELDEQIRDVPATVLRTTGLIAVKFDNGAEWDAGKDYWLFAENELDLLQEAHPLTNEFAKSPETASENNSDGAPFKVGDLVKVVNYHLVWDGTVGKVHEIYSDSFVNIRNETHKEFGLGFHVNNLELVGEAL